MAIGALVAAYQEDDSGGLRALLPLAGRTLLEYQVRCAAAAGAAPIVVLVSRIPQELNAALERLRLDALPVIAVSDGNEAASRFEPGSLILLLGDGVVVPLELLTRMAEEPEPAVATVPDDEAHQQFERIDAASRWAGVAMVDGRTLGATAAMLGDWDLQSTLLRAALQHGAARLSTTDTELPLLADSSAQLADFERRLIVSSRGSRRDWASRYILPIVEDFATERLLETGVRPRWLIWTALVLMLAAALAFLRGWMWPALGLLVLSTPLDLVARRLALLQLRPMPSRSWSRRLLWPAAGIALLALGWQLATGLSGWGAFVTAVSAAAFAEAARIERGRIEVPGEQWLFSRRNAILAAVPLALLGGWTLTVVAIALYAAGSFFVAQYVRHAID